MRNRNVRLFILAFPVFLSAGVYASDVPVVRTKFGPVSGKTSGAVRAYLGIPYAAPPVGELRWKPPRDPKPWRSTLACVELPAACPQPSMGAGFVRKKLRMDEDCLYLNVWTPARKADAKLAVMVWIHGGGFVIGSSAKRVYAGESLAKKGVVVVTINYRLGPFGFLAHPALSAESPNGASGNWGLMDQVHALKWVRANIAAFGGDPGNVTIFGESAGAVSVYCLMSSPLARGLFHRAIAQSGAAPSRMAHLKERRGAMVSAETLGEGVARRLGATKGTGAETLTAMREKSWREVLEASKSNLVIMPGSSSAMLLCVDGYVLPDTPGKIFTAGGQASVPLLAGSNADEGTIFTRRMKVDSLAALKRHLRLKLGPMTDKAMEIYGATDDASAKRAITEMIGDAFVAGARRAVRSQSRIQGRTYLYHFTRSTRWARRMGLGCFHGAEIPYVFGHLPGRLYGEEDEKLSEKIMNYWVGFARSGDPNAVGAANWPAYSEKTDTHLELGVPVRTGKGLRKKQCDFLDSLSR